MTGDASAWPTLETGVAGADAASKRRRAENDEIARNCLFRLRILRDDATVRAVSCLIARFCAAIGPSECAAQFGRTPDAS
ncbi:hypothetical protein [Caballeronia glebae]|uniref:hypothetical protein n=1 Tax=Caballeronia glebae TaxID=1777143 RepID=UPI00117E8DB3|nr:hypothetical protein [Caballeronia glebae]